MDYYYHQFHELQDEFQDTLSKYPLFKEMIDDIFQKDVLEIDDLIKKDDEFYLKKAIDKLKDLINYIKTTSEKITHLYQEFDTLAKEWEKIEILNVSSKELDEINQEVIKANSLIKSHNLKDIEEANKIMYRLLRQR